MFVGNLSNSAFIFGIPSNTVTSSFVLFDKASHDPLIRYLLVLVIYSDLFIICIKRSLIIVENHRKMFFDF